MIILLGASGYIGEAFARELSARGQAFISPARRDLDYTRFGVLLDFLKAQKPAFLINCAGYTGKPNVDACEDAKADTLLGNSLFAQTVAHACEAASIPWGHISSGCIFSGAKVVRGGEVQIEKDLTRPDLHKLTESDPEAIRGFTEEDTPNFTFRQPPCSFYSGSKALGEEAIAGVGNHYVWRLRIPFDEYDNPRNYLSKVQRYPKVYENVNSISHRTDFAQACLDLWATRAPFGIYNITNPGFVTTRQVVGLIEKILKPNRQFEFWKDDAEFYRVAARTPRSNCVLDVSKLLGAGVRIRPVIEALEASLNGWKKEPGG
jgi:dTDP-4-dehydrorhamnose reductase